MCSRTASNQSTRARSRGSSSGGTPPTSVMKNVAVVRECLVSEMNSEGILSRRSMVSNDSSARPPESPWAALRMRTSSSASETRRRSVCKPRSCKRVAVDRGRSHQGDGEDYADGDCGHEPAVAIETTHRNPERRGERSEDAAHAASCRLVVLPAVAAAVPGCRWLVVVGRGMFDRVAFVDY